MLPSWLQSFVERVGGRGWNRWEGEMGGGKGKIESLAKRGKRTREEWRRTGEKKEWRGIWERRE